MGLDISELVQILFRKYTYDQIIVCIIVPLIDAAQSACIVGISLVRDRSLEFKG